MIFTIVSGLFIVEPIFYGVAVALSLTGLLVTAIVLGDDFDNFDEVIKKMEETLT